MPKRRKHIRDLIIVAVLAVATALIGFTALADGEPNTRIDYCAALLGERHGMEFAVLAENCGAGAAVGVEIRCDSPTATAREAEYYDTQLIEGRSYRVYIFDDMTAADVTMELYATPYTVIDGNRLYGETEKISVLEYAYKALGKADDYEIEDGEVKLAVRELLDKGAAAQTAGGIRTDRLATDEYYMVRTVGGVVVSDGFAKQLVKSGDSVEIAASPRDDVRITGWKDSAGNTVSESLTFTVTPTANETYTVITRGFERTVEYDACGGVLPDGLPVSYVEGEGKIELADPEREGYVFAGWFSSSDFDEDSRVSGINADTRGNLTLYAKWSKIISSLDGDAILSKGKQTLNASSDIGTVKNGFTAKDGVLTWTQGDSIRSQMAMNGNIYGNAEGATSVTVVATMAKGDNPNTVKGQFRLRRADASFVSVINPFTITRDGMVLLGGQTGCVIAKLGEEFTTVRVVVDFAEKTMTAYDDEGRTLLVHYFTLPGADAAELTHTEWFSKVTSTLWQFYAEHNDGGSQLKIKNISIHAGNSVKVADDDANGVNEEKLDELKELIDGQRDKITEENLFGSSTADINASAEDKHKNKWGTVPYDPIAEHPRLYVTSDRLSAIRESIEMLDSTTKMRFRSMLSIELADGGVLPPPDTQGTNTTVDLDEIHNFNASYLEIIQIKALGYLLYGNEYYGYQAIYYMKNYLDSLDIVQIYDQTREYGAVMHTAAIVYDWCYPLLTDVDKEQLIAGVENRICRHRNAFGLAMEVGFPPYGGGAVNGHSSERMILRDYLSFATAIFGDNDSWWDYVAARVWNEFAPVRNYYFQAGAVHQGTSYAVGRHISDLFSDWILTVATGGKTPYNEYMATAIKGILGYECSKGKIFNDGDATGDYKTTDGYLHPVFIAAYLYADGELLAHGLDMLGNGVFTNAYNYLTSPLYLVLVGLSDIEPAEDKYAGMDLIQYNGHPLGQYIIREEWSSNDSAAVIMRIKERNTGNHEHKDSGTFEIYYKGALSTDGGCYNNYGHYHTQYFHQSTISHNGLIIFNPSKWNYNSSDVATKWYSGSQRPVTNPSNLDKLLGDSCDVATLTARQHGYFDGDETKPQYAYIAGDITKAYYEDTVDFVGRRMLTAYTGNEDFPMVFFVFDDVTSDKVSYEKRFLLQISSKEAPVIEGNTVITENGDGRLVLTCLSDKVRLDAVGGRAYGENGKYDQKNSANYLINGYQCLPKSSTADDGHWGRVEIVYTGLYNRATFMNVIYVTDKGQTKTAPAVEKVVGTSVEGGVFSGTAAIFTTSRNKVSSKISCTVPGDGSITYYVSGVAAGEWQISVGGASYGTATATAEGGLLTFTAPAGELVLEKR